ncbi:uncharacterized protein LOC143898154 isoform X2 [Temnothorax americanus]|uniref:uncharacterized protein LOC143898154 isoform X2 n=1 Tax=Temnothorax americanus TaxID=1964332 RepID=UPI0040693439
MFVRILLQFREEIAGSSVHKLGQQSNERVNSHADGSSCRTETVVTRQSLVGRVAVVPTNWQLTLAKRLEAVCVP